MADPRNDGENVNAFRMTTGDPGEKASESMQDVAEQAVERADEEQAADLGEEPSPEERHTPLAQDEP